MSENSLTNYLNINREKKPLIAYFSLEIALSEHIPSYHGGLGILAGDILRSCADLELNTVGLALFCQYGSFKQKLDENGLQTNELPTWEVEKYFKKHPTKFSVQIQGREVWGQIWQYDLVGATGQTNPVLFLDAALPENHELDQKISYQLYSADPDTWLRQQIFFGLGGVKALQILGYPLCDTYHLNESHDIFALLELRRILGSWAEVKKRSSFTIHTPLPGAHADLDFAVLEKYLTREEISMLQEALVGLEQETEGKNGETEGKVSTSFNQTKLALQWSKFANAVAKKHEEVTEESYPGFQIYSVTNGVHTGLWTSPHLAKVFDRFTPDWRIDAFSLRMAHRIPLSEITQAHALAKQDLLDYVEEKCQLKLDPKKLTIGFARRSIAYKRANFIFTDFERLLQISKNCGGLQLIFSGKAHPSDELGKEIIQKIFDYSKRAQERPDCNLQIVYLPNYNMKIGSLITSGVDLWLNNPIPPLEASGTSGMKANLNAIPNLSILDGWWLEGWIEGVTGWSIGQECTKEDCSIADLDSLYSKLEKNIIPAFYENPEKWSEIGRNCIMLNGAYFSTHRTVMEYLAEGWIK